MKANFITNTISKRQDYACSIKNLVDNAGELLTLNFIELDILEKDNTPCIYNAGYLIGLFGDDAHFNPEHMANYDTDKVLPFTPIGIEGEYRLNDSYLFSAYERLFQDKVGNNATSEFINLITRLNKTQE